MNEPLVIYTIYSPDPADHPDAFVVRAWNIRQPPETGTAQTAASLDAARRLLPPGLVWIGPGPLDPPNVVESWL